MERNQLKQEIYDHINHDGERFLRLVYSMVEREKTEKGFFNVSTEAMRNRAERSLKSIANEKTRGLDEFKKDIESWKENRAIQ